MDDTWSTLEQRFRELAAKAPELFLNVHPAGAEWESVPGEYGIGSRSVLTGWQKGERGWNTPSGRWEFFTSGERGNLHVDELVQLINRADRLLSGSDAESDSSRFVGIALEHYGDAALSLIRNAEFVFRDRPPSCVGNAAEFCALTAGYIGADAERFCVDPPLGAVEEVGPFEPAWLRLLFICDDNRTLKDRLSYRHREETQRKWHVPRDLLNDLGDWQETLRRNADTLPEKDKQKIFAFLSLH